jgi:hypothetical protein
VSRTDPKLRLLMFHFAIMMLLMAGAADIISTTTAADTAAIATNLFVVEASCVV